MPKKKASKSDFVRAQPANLTAADVVAKAKEAGITLTESHVYATRSYDKSKGAKAKKSAPAAAPSPTPVKASGPKTSASAYIRSQPGNLTAKEVAEKGASEGYTFKSSLVYDVRAAAKKRAGKQAKLGRPKSTNAVSIKASSTLKPVAAAASASSQKAQFRRFMIDIGLTQAEALYAEVHRELRAIRDRE